MGCCTCVHIFIQHCLPFYILFILVQPFSITAHFYHPRPNVKHRMRPERVNGWMWKHPSIHTHTHWRLWLLCRVSPAHHKLTSGNSHTDCASWGGDLCPTWSSSLSSWVLMCPEPALKYHLQHPTTDAVWNNNNGLRALSHCDAH